MSEYRYRTPAVVGPWRRTPEEAREDAVRAGQAERDRADPSRIVWRSDGHIEQKQIQKWDQ